VSSHNLGKLKIDDLELLGYSVAGEETVFIVPQLDVCFDLGKAPQQMIPINHALLTHGHMDHSAGIAYYLSHRNFCGMPAGTLLAPEPLIKPIQAIIEAYGQLDGNPIPAKIVGLKGGEEYQVKPNLWARAFAVRHSRGALGYSIVEKRKKLKPEYLPLSGPELVKLKQQGIAIDYQVELPIISYFGDTEYADFAKQEFVLKSKILVTECTFFLDEHIERAQAGRHMHVNDLAGLLENSQNEHIILMHVTQRTGISEIRRIIRNKCPKNACEKIIVLEENEFSFINKRGQ
jgi:ribonuclease Z